MSNKKVFTNSIIYIFSNYLLKFISFFSSYFILSQLGGDWFGVISHIKAGVFFLAPMVWIGFDNVLFKVEGDENEKGLIVLLGGMYLVISIGFTLLLSFIPELYIGEILYTEFNLDSISVFCFITSGLLLLFFRQLLVTKERGLGVVFIDITLGISGILLNVIVVMNNNISYTLYILSAAISAIVIVYIIRYMRTIFGYFQSFINVISIKEHRKSFLKSIKKIISFARHFSLASIIGAISRRIIQIFLANRGMSEGLGLLSLHTQLLSIIESFGWAINNAFGINRLRRMLQSDDLEASEKKYLNEIEKVTKVLLGIVLLSSPIWIGYAMISFAKFNYENHIYMLVIAITTTLFTINIIGTFIQYNILYVREKLGKQVLFKTIFNIFVIFINIFLANQYGLIGSLFALLYPSIVYFLFGEFLIRKNVVLRIKKLLLTAVILLPMSGIVIINWVYGIAILCFIAIVTLIYLLLSKELNLIAMAKQIFLKSEKR